MSTPTWEQVKQYFAALRRAQSDIDLHTHRYTHYYRKEFPTRFHPIMDPRRFGPGERIVFEPYTREMYEGRAAVDDGTGDLRGEESGDPGFQCINKRERRLIASSWWSFRDSWMTLSDRVIWERTEPLGTDARVSVRCGAVLPVNAPAWIDRLLTWLGPLWIGLWARGAARRISP